MDARPDRREALVDLIDLREPIEAAIRSLSVHPMGTTPDVVFGGSQILRALQMFLTGDITSRELERWANAIECRDDVEHDPGCSSAVADFLFEAATPEVNGVFTMERASEWTERFA